MKTADTRPAPINCPDAAGCHLVVELSREGGALVAMASRPYPLSAIRANANRLSWLEGLGFLGARIGPKQRFESPMESMALGFAAGDLRATAQTQEALLLLTSNGLLALNQAGRSLSTVTPESSAWALATDGRAAILSTGAAGSSTGAILRVVLASGSVEVAASGEARPGPVAIDEGGLYWATFGGGPALDGAGSVRMLAIGGAPVTLAAGESAPRSLATSASHVYWISDAPDGRHLRRVSKRGGPPLEVAHIPGAQGTRGEERLLVAGDEAFALFGGRLYRAPAAAGPATPVLELRPPSGRVVSFDVDHGSIYATVEFPAGVQAKLERARRRH